MTLQAYISKSIDHPGLVSALCQELGIAEFVDNQLPNQSQHRHIVKVILNLNGRHKTILDCLGEGYWRAYL